MIGSLRHRLVIEVRTRTPDAGGGASESWATHATLWGALRAGTPLARPDPEAVALQVPHIFRIRHRTDLTNDMRVRIADRLFALTGLVDPDGRRRWLDLYCLEWAGA